MAESPAAAPPLDLTVDAAAEADRIAAAIARQVHVTLKRHGVVVGMSGGVDSSVCAALAVRSLGARRVFGLLMPESESAADSEDLARAWADELGIAWAVEDITPMLQATGCYGRRDAAIRRLVPEFGAGWRCKVTLPANRLDDDLINVPTLTVAPPDGEPRSLRLPAREYREIVAATSFKQRLRKMLEYYHADRLHYAVLGTPNRLEYDQGFFVKGGDGLADLKPIAHLYKSQVYQLAEHLGVPAAIGRRAPTTDTYSLPQTQQEFYFSVPPLTLDLALAAHDDGVPPEIAAGPAGLRADQMVRLYRDIEQKRSTTQYLHEAPLLVDPDIAPSRSRHPQ